MLTLEDAVWIYYGYPNRDWKSKCQRCREQVLTHRKPVGECINCWKLEIWGQGEFLNRALRNQPTHWLHDPVNAWPKSTNCMSDKVSGEGNSDRTGLVRKKLQFLVERLVFFSGSSVAKVSKYPIHVIRSGVPIDAYPCVKLDFLLMVYARSLKQRDELRALLCDLLPVDRRFATRIPVRRGCWIYDDILGPWQEWYPLDQDFPR